MPAFMGNDSQVDLKKKASLKQNQKMPQILSPVVKKKRLI